jgi:hypothetical protein
MSKNICVLHNILYYFQLNEFNVLYTTLCNSKYYFHLNAIESNDGTTNEIYISIINEIESLLNKRVYNKKKLSYYLVCCS